MTPILGCREEHSRILLAVPRHDADSVAGSQPHGQHCPGQQAALVIQLIVRPSGARPWYNEALPCFHGADIAGSAPRPRKGRRGRVGWAVQKRELPRTRCLETSSMLLAAALILLVMKLLRVAHTW